jgi:hypothetical protein
MGRDTLLGLAQSQRRTLSYVVDVSVTSTAGAYNEATTVTLNNPFSPNGGGSVVGYAKYMAFYSKAFVLGTRAKYSACAFSASAAIFTGITITTNNTSLGSAQAAIENGMCDYHVSGTNPDRLVFNQTVDVARFLNKPRILDDPQLFSTSAAGPTQLIVLHMWAAAPGATTFTISGLLELEMEMVFTDPIPFT